MRGGQQPAGGRPLCHTFSIIQFWSQLAWRGKLPLPKLCCPGRAAVPALPAAAGVRTVRSLQSHLSNSQGAALSLPTPCLCDPGLQGGVRAGGCVGVALQGPIAMEPIVARGALPLAGGMLFRVTRAAPGGAERSVERMLLKGAKSRMHSGRRCPRHGCCGGRRTTAGQQGRLLCRPGRLLRLCGEAGLRG